MVVVLIAVSPVGARGAVTVYADEIPTSAVTPTAVTNPPAAETSTGGTKASDADHPPVRIDETGVHVGGPNPVDINMPEYAGNWQHGSSFAAMVKAVVAICATFGMPVAIILVIGYFGHRRNKLAHETMRIMIEKGVPMTPELVAEIRSRNSGASGRGPTRSRLLPGLVLAGVGTALLIGGSRGEARGGWIVLFIGAAFLIVWLVEGKNQSDGQPPR